LVAFFVKLPHVGLANIIMDFEGKSPVHPEMFQEDVNKENLLNIYETMDRDHFDKKRQELREILKYGSAKRVAEMVMR